MYNVLKEQLKVVLCWMNDWLYVPLANKIVTFYFDVCKIIYDCDFSSFISKKDKYNTKLDIFDRSMKVFMFRIFKTQKYYNYRQL